MFEPLLEDEDEVMKYTAVAVYKVSLIFLSFTNDMTN